MALRRLIASAISMKLKAAWVDSFVSKASFDTRSKSAGAAMPPPSIFSQRSSRYFELRNGSTCSIRQLMEISVGSASPFSGVAISESMSILYQSVSSIFSEAVSTTSDDTLEADLSQVSFHQDDVFHIEDLSVLIWEHVILCHN